MRFYGRDNKKKMTLFFAGVLLFGIGLVHVLFPNPERFDGEGVAVMDSMCHCALSIPAEKLAQEAKAVMTRLNNAQTRSDDPKLVEAFRKWFLTAANNKPYNLTAKAKVSSAWGERHLPYIEALPTGFFIECGGYDGETLSNTLFLEGMLGWEGILIEADPNSYKKLLSKNRKSWSSNTCVSTKDYPLEAKLFQNTKHPEVNGLTFRNYHKLNTKITSQCFPLYTMLLALNRTVIDFFSLDVEGAELDILQTIPFDKITIRFLLVEVVNIREPGEETPTKLRQGGDPRGAKRMKQFMTSKGFELFEKVPMGAGNDLMFKYTGLIPVPIKSTAL